VCTGSLVLGAAGLLQGYKATSHWVARHVLTTLGASPVNSRVVTDRNRITGAGVTAGFDFGLNVVAQLRDPDYAKAVQSLAEYHPEPPFDAGSPERAPAETTKMLTEMFAPFVERAQSAARDAAARMSQQSAPK
jgi:transcriptional regulator GlxA family with amidase domain